MQFELNLRAKKIYTSQYAIYKLARYLTFFPRFVRINSTCDPIFTVQTAMSMCQNTPNLKRMECTSSASSSYQECLKLRMVNSSTCSNSVVEQPLENVTLSNQQQIDTVPSNDDDVTTAVILLGPPNIECKL